MPVVVTVIGTAGTAVFSGTSTGRAVRVVMADGQDRGVIEGGSSGTITVKM